MREEGEKIDFFPVNRAQCLEKKNKDETKKEFDELKTMVTQVLSKFEKQVATGHDLHYISMKSSHIYMDVYHVHVLATKILSKPNHEITS